MGGIRLSHQTVCRNLVTLTPFPSLIIRVGSDRSAMRVRTGSRPRQWVRRTLVNN